jgi:predicted transcriptional regulator
MKPCLEIARTVAASREMVSRVVKKLTDDGLVRKERRKTVILDRLSMSAVCPL